MRDISCVSFIKQETFSINSLTHLKKLITQFVKYEIFFFSGSIDVVFDKSCSNVTHSTAIGTRSFFIIFTV